MAAPNLHTLERMRMLLEQQNMALLAHIRIPIVILERYYQVLNIHCTATEC